MIIDWLTFAPALCLLLVPIGLFHGKKIRFCDISRDWEGHRSAILALSLHWIDLTRAALGGWLLIHALTHAHGVAGFMRYSILGIEGAVMVLAVGLQTFVCKEEDSAHAPFAFVTGLVLGVYPPIVAGFSIALAIALAAGSRVPVAYFPALGVLLAGIGFGFEGKKALILLGLGTCALILPWLFTIMFPRDLVFSYRARRRSLDAEKALPPHR